MENRKVAVVVASNRPESLKKFCEAWYPYAWDALHVVCDGPKVFPEVLSSGGAQAGFNTSGYCWKDIDALGSDGEIFSRQDAGIKSFGFLMAYRAGANIIISLDDDCLEDDNFPPKDFVKQHVANLEGGFDSVRSTVPGLRVRGMPYYAKCAPMQSVVASLGLWTGVPDLDAASTLVNGIPSDFRPVDGVGLCDPDLLYPMSGMNLCFSSVALPLMYFPKMGRDLPYRRFDDIWAGLFAQIVMRMQGWRMSFGEPFIHHSRASDPLKNLAAEAPGLAMNDALWKLLSAAVGFLKFDSWQLLSASIEELSAYMLRYADRTPDPGYVEQWMSNLDVWQRLIEARAPTLQSGA